MTSKIYGLIAGAMLACSGPCFGSTLSEIEHWAQESADVLAIADLETEWARQRLHMVQGASGARWILGAAVGRFQEPLTDSTSRSYSRINATAGLRIPLLGSAEASAREVEDADRVLGLSALQRAQALVQVTHDVRLAYSAYVRNAQRVAMAQAWLGLQAPAEPVLAARTREHALLQADRLAMQSAFQVARRDLDRYTLEMRTALATLRRLSKHSLDDIQPEPPVWPTACLQRDALLAELDQRPALAIKRLESEARARQLGLMRWGAVEAGLTLQQSLAQDLGGQSGSGTVLGVDLSLPFELGSRSTGPGTQGQIRLQQARQDLEATRAEQSDLLDAVLGRLHNSQSDLERAEQRLQGSLEGDRIAGLRAGNLPGDVLEKALMARYELYLSSIDWVDTLQRGDLAQLEALDFGPGCMAGAPALGEPQAGREAVPGVPGGLPSRLAQPLPSPAASPAAAKLALAWFVWHAEALLQPQGLAVAAQPGRLLVSFTAEQLRALQSHGPSAQQLRLHLQALHAAGWSVDWLLGDARYVLPPGREQLLSSVRAMAGFAFDGLNLDLERSDLPAHLQASWWPLTLATLRAVHAASAWPLTLTTHFRELDQAPLQAALQQAGVVSVMAMVYVRDLRASTEIGRRILARQAPLPIWLVQSVEPQLAATEGGFASGRQANLLHWTELTQRLADMPNFLGIAVQSLDHFHAMQP